MSITTEEAKVYIELAALVIEKGTAVATSLIEAANTDTLTSDQVAEIRQGLAKPSDTFADYPEDSEG